MKISLALAFALATFSLPAVAQNADTSNKGAASADQHNIESPKLNDADRMELKKGSELVLSGAQGFFGALTAAVNKAHEDRAVEKKQAAPPAKAKSLKNAEKIQASKANRTPGNMDKPVSR